VVDRTGVVGNDQNGRGALIFRSSDLQSERVHRLVPTQRPVRRQRPHV
jgi:hypothetical protein